VHSGSLEKITNTFETFLLKYLRMPNIFPDIKDTTYDLSNIKQKQSLTINMLCRQLVQVPNSAVYLNFLKHIF